MKTLTALLLAAVLISLNVQADDVNPQPQTVNGVTFVTGGVGDSEIQAMNEMKKMYNLHLMFVDKETGSYMADINVKILDKKGASILESVSQGPFFFAKLNPGKYKIVASYNEQEQSEAIVITGKKAVSKSFYLKARMAPPE